ncbi:hypothetical protein LVD15_14810 [Fulvivirga maritima]|uniref:hypothetical protein n=1 Tax=Fulvivirga maritima TaxID=2904247 RepID=UPI001F34944C|nr:hypothetical protein [Fulvivirga maritima]UII24594.1 hypothetical protein LVD15_14810 [Fulvivirga maritima]
MLHDSDVFMNKVELIMESPTERNKYKGLDTINERLDFLRNHFIMNEMAVRLLERKYLLSEESRDDLLSTIDDIIKKWDS